MSVTTTDTMPLRGAPLSRLRMSSTLCSSTGRLPDDATSHLQVSYQQGSAQCYVQQQIFMASTLQAARRCNKHLSVAQAGISTGLVQQQRH